MAVRCSMARSKIPGFEEIRPEVLAEPLEFFQFQVSKSPLLFDRE